MSSDNARRGNTPDVRFLPAGTGLAVKNYSCNQCMTIGKSLVGGGKQYVRWAGRKLWVCAGCLKVPA